MDGSTGQLLTLFRRLTFGQMLSYHYSDIDMGSGQSEVGRAQQ